MKTLKLNFILAASALLLVAQSNSQTVTYKGTSPGNGSKVKIDGTSTVHDWTVESKLVAGTLEIDSDFTADLKTFKTTPKATVRIPVRQLHDTLNQTAMDNVMYEALKAANFSTIEFKLVELKSKDSKFEATGTLMIAGVTRTNTMPVSFERIDKSKIKIACATSVKMSDFNVKPPVLSVPPVTTGDDVKISLDWVVEKKDAAK